MSMRGKPDIRHAAPDGQAGYVLLAVTVLVFAMIVGGMALFATASYESKHALRDYDSAEAFYLADSAIERARAMLLEDRAWRDGWNDVALDRGTYDLAIADTTLGGISGSYVRLTGTGTVNRTSRRVTAVAEVPPAGLNLGLLGMDDAVSLFNPFCVNGRAHINEWCFFGFRNRNFQCGTLTSGFDLTPPHLYVDADHFPGATYYEVRPTKIGAVHNARIFDADGIDITTSRGDSLTSVLTYSSLLGSYIYTFSGNTAVDRYFDETTGVFRRAAGDSSVVVNFGGAPLNTPPGPNAVHQLYIGNTSRIIRATIINTRFTGITVEQRLQYGNWRAGLTILDGVTFAPRNGMTLICGMFHSFGTSNYGNARYPGLVYITGFLNSFWGDLNARGSIIMMGDFVSLADVTITYDPLMLDRMPDYMEEEWPDRVSGSSRIITWREVSAPTGG